MTHPDLDLGELSLEPRPYQIRVIRKALDHLCRQENPVRSLMIESPTGSGKTIVALLIARYLQQRYGYDVVWVAMRRNLLAQARSENERRGIHVRARFMTMFEQLSDVELGERLAKRTLCVIDEAQHDATRSMCRLHSQLRPDRTLGLSATPYRTDRLKLCFEKSVTDAGIAQLVELGYLAAFQTFVIPQYSPRGVAEFYLREPDRWLQTLIFFHRYRQCLECEQLLKDAGVRCAVVTAKSDREQQLLDFDQGRYQVLLNMAILTEGYDGPVETVFCRPSGKGPTLQMVGRCLRKQPNVAVKNIVQCKETRWPFVKTARPVQQFVWTESGWRTLDVNPLTAAVSTKCLETIAHTQVSKLPGFILENRDAARADEISTNPTENSR